MKIKKKHITGILLIIIIGLYYFFEPSRNSYFLKCPLKIFTGYDCPGCGSQRAFHSLLHFRFREAFAFNPLFVILFFCVFVFLCFRFFGGDEKFSVFRNLLTDKKFLIVLLIIILLFFVIRNTDFYKNFVISLAEI